jgi:hypothetical protein
MRRCGFCQKVGWYEQGEVKKAASSNCPWKADFAGEVIEHYRNHHATDAASLLTLSESNSEGQLHERKPGKLQLLGQLDRGSVQIQAQCLGRKRL